MKKFYTILLAVTVAILLLWQLPWLYSFATAKKSKSPFIVYSTLVNDFILSEHDGTKMVFTDLNSNNYTQHQADSILPYFYSRQLLKDERFPDSIKGKPVTFRDAQLSSFTFRVSPKDINSPKIGLYQLLESMSPRVKLETSDDVFRFTKSGVEFIDCETNALNQEKSRLFTEMFQKKDFKFPVKHIDGLPSPRKDYDEGYILVDADNQLYHFKQTVGRPYLRKIDAPENVKIKYGYITEFNDKKSIAFAVDTDNNLYIVENKTYKFHKVGVPSFDPEKNAMMILGNMSDWTVKISSIDKVVYYAIDANDYSLLKEYSEPMDESFGTKVDDFIASIGIRFTHPLDKFVYPRIGY